MKKKIRVSLMFMLTLFVTLPAIAQTYNNSDKEVLRKVLRQYDYYNSNLTTFGLVISDTTNWNTSENWVPKVKGVTWDNSSPKRLIAIDWKPLKLTSNVDFSPCSSLERLSMHTGIYSSFGDTDFGPILNNNPKLKSLKIQGFTIEEKGFNSNVNLDSLSLNYCRLKGQNIDFSKNINLRYLDLFYQNGIKHLDLSKNGALEFINFSYILTLESINVKNCTKLKYLTGDFTFNNDTKTGYYVLDLSNNSELISVVCPSNQLDELILPKNSKLKELNCRSNNLKTLVLPDNPSLQVIACSSNPISKIDLSKQINLESFSMVTYVPTLKGTLDLTKNINLKSLYITHMYDFDISNCTKLSTIGIYDNNLPILDFSKNKNLGHISIESTKTEKIILPDVPNKVDTLNLIKTKFKFSTLPPTSSQYKEYLYSYQDTIVGEPVSSDDIIDLSGEYLIGGKQTTYKWYLGKTPITLTSAGNGKFKIPTSYNDSELLCEMTNATFPRLTQIYTVKVGTVSGEAYSKKDKDVLRKVLRQYDNEGRNLANLGLTVSDTIKWNESEVWVSKVKGLGWDDSSPKRLRAINWKEIALTSNVDFSPCLNLDSLSLDYCRLNWKNIDLSKNVALKFIVFKNNRDIKEEYNILDLSNNSELLSVNCLLNKFDELILPHNAKLKELNCQYNYFETLVFPNNPSLEAFNFTGRLNEINLSSQTNLKLLVLEMFGPSTKGILDLTKNTNLQNIQLQEIPYFDISNCTKLESISIYATDMSIIDLSNNKDLTGVYIEEANTEKIILPEAPNKVKRIYLKRTKFKFSTLPLMSSQYETYDYSLQDTIIGKSVIPDDIIDLSSEFLIGEKKTTYKWYSGKNPITLPIAGDGKFAVPTSYHDSELLCEMTNATFPKLKQIYKVKVGAVSDDKYSRLDKEVLRQVLRQSDKKEHNLLYLGLVASDTITWNESEEWVTKVKGIKWDDSSPKRILFINWAPIILTSDIDFSPCENLESLSLDKSDVSSIDGSYYKPIFKNNIKLKTLKVEGFGIDVNGFSKNVDLDSVSLNRCLLEDSKIDFSKNINLKYLNLYEQQGLIENLDLTNNKKLEYLNISYMLTLESLNVKNCTQLKVLNSEYAFNTESREKYYTLDLSNNAELDSLTCGYNLIDELILPRKSKLKTLNAISNKINKLVLPDNACLEKIILTDNPLAKIDLSKQTGLKYLELLTPNDTSMEMLDLSKNTELELIGIAGIRDFDISNCTKLNYFYSTNSDVSVIDLSKNKDLEKIELGYGNISTLILPEDQSKINEMRLSNLKLKYSTLPLPLATNKIYFYEPQDTIKETVSVNGIVDLSSEYLINGKQSTYKWYQNNVAITLSDAGNGKFTIPAKYEGKELICKMTNATFPKLTLVCSIAVTKDVVSNYNEKEIEALKIFLLQPSAIKSKMNYHSFGLTDNEIKKWDADAINKVTGIVWNSEVPKQIVQISWDRKSLGGTFNASQFSSLEVLSCANNSLTALDASNNTKLTSLDISKNELINLDLVKNTSLETVNCSNNKISEIKINNTVTNLNCNSNALLLSTLPSIALKDYDYSEQESIDGGSKSTKDIIDLSSEFTVGGKTTNYEWYSGSKKVTLEDQGKGKFTATAELMGKKLECRMTNTTFPGLTTRYIVNITGTSGIEEDFDKQSVYLVSQVINRGEPITVINGTGLQAKMSIYSLTGNKVSEVNINDYTTHTYIYIQGVYIVQITLSDRTRRSHKILIK